MISNAISSLEDSKVQLQEHCLNIRTEAKKYVKKGPVLFFYGELDMECAILIEELDILIQKVERHRNKEESLLSLLK